MITYMFSCCSSNFFELLNHSLGSGHKNIFDLEENRCSAPSKKFYQVTAAPLSYSVYNLY